MIRFNALIEAADRFARWHVKQQGIVGPDVQAFWRHWDVYCERRAQEWSHSELTCISGYALAACAYDLDGKPDGRGLWSNKQFGLSESQPEAA